MVLKDYNFEQPSLAASTQSAAAKRAGCMVTDC